MELGIFRSILIVSIDEPIDLQTNALYEMENNSPFDESSFLYGGTGCDIFDEVHHFSLILTKKQRTRSQCRMVHFVAT